MIDWVYARMCKNEIYKCNFEDETCDIKERDFNIIFIVVLVLVKYLIVDKYYIGICVPSGRENVINLHIVRVIQGDGVL